jgi:hypothetical protein
MDVHFILRNFTGKQPSLIEFFQENEKDPASFRHCKAFSYLNLRTKGMGEIFHGQTKGYMFACEQLHICNISRIN